MGAGSAKPKLHKRYPLASIFAYNLTTIAHYFLGASGLVLGFGRWPAVGWALGGAYLAFALTQMYVLMPLTVCPSCVYRMMEGSRCVSAMNVISAKLTGLRDRGEFAERGRGVLCHNNLYMASLIAPLVLMLPGLVFDFSIGLLAVILAVAGLLAFRIFLLFPRIACGHCVAKTYCPNAQSMGLA